MDIGRDNSPKIPSGTPEVTAAPRGEGITGPASVVPKVDTGLSELGVDLSGISEKGWLGQRRDEQVAFQLDTAASILWASYELGQQTDVIKQLLEGGSAENRALTASVAVHAIEASSSGHPRSDFEITLHALNINNAPSPLPVAEALDEWVNGNCSAVHEMIIEETIGGTKWDCQVRAALFLTQIMTEAEKWREGGARGVASYFAAQVPQSRVDEFLVRLNSIRGADTFENVFEGKDEDAPLYAKYEGQSEAQPAFVEINLDAETLDAKWDPIVGPGVSKEVYDGKVIRFAVPAEMSGQAVDEILKGIAPLVERVIKGGDREFDLSDDGREAQEEIEAICQKVCEDFKSNGPEGTLYEAKAWLAPLDQKEILALLGNLSTIQRGQPADLDTVVASLAQQAKKDHERVAGDVKDALRERVQEIINHVGNCLITDTEMTISGGLKVLGRLSGLKDYKVELSIRAVLHELEFHGKLGAGTQECQLAIGILQNLTEVDNGELLRTLEGR